MGVDIDSLEGTGPGGRVTQQDVESAAAAPQRGAPAPTARAPATPGRPAPAPQRPPAAPAGVAATDQWGATRRVALSQIRKTIAAQMVRSVSSIPHVTHHDEADITELDRLRRGYHRKDDPATKLTLMPFVIRALCASLRQHPILNASFDGDANEIIYKEYFNIGIAVDTPRGLIVPVIRDADRLGITELAGALAVIAEKVRTSQFTIDELRGGTFTITNYGAIGGMFGTPIINYPEVAILGMGRAQKRVVAHDGKMEVRTILPLSVSFDHRATDGAEVARFVNDFAALLQNPARLLL
jgi:pyruvate dehydrogenase E2 component (dihydrolipoamide acetyltransferase)